MFYHCVDFIVGGYQGGSPKPQYEGLENVSNMTLKAEDYGAY